MPHPLFTLLDDLDAEQIYYSLERTRPDTVRVNVTVVGKRIEVDVFDDGHVEVSEFTGSEHVIGDAETVKALIASNP